MEKDALSSHGFTDEQIAALQNAFGQLEQKLATNTGSGQPASVFGTPVEDLCKEEVAKYEQHPLDLWTRLELWTAKNEIATGLDQFLLRHLGFFNVEPNSPGYMVRLRIPGCQITGEQLMAIADIAERFAGGYAHITTRGNIQMREIEPKNVMHILDALNRAGLSCQGSGADSARNMTTSPTAGFDRQELIDLRSHVKRLAYLVLNTRELRALPRKFNISFDGGGSISCVGDSNDICFQAVRIEDGGATPAGIYCRIGLGGISGHLELTRATGFIATPEQTVLAGMAMLYVFVEHADRTNRKKARLKYLLDKHGVEWFMEQTQHKLDELQAGFQLMPDDGTHDVPRPAINRQGHIGIHPQAQDDTSYIGLPLPMGRLSLEQMRAIGSIAQEYGEDDLRLTVWQNMLIPHITKADIPKVEDLLAQVGLKTQASAFAAGAIACTGMSGCKLALAYTKEDGLRLVQHLEQRFQLDTPINIHLTGCPNSCAQHYIGDIGLVGASLADGSQGYYLVVGGGSDQHKRLGRPLGGPYPSSDINTLVEKLIANYTTKRASSSQSFYDFIARVADEALPALVE